MVGSRTRSPQGGDRPGKPPGRRAGRRARGLDAIERNGVWHVVGTVRAGGRSIRYRKSSGLPVATVGYEAARDEARRIEAEIVGQATGRRRPGDFVAQAAERYLTRPRRRALGASSIRIVKEVVVAFGLRRLNEIDPEEWIAFVDHRHAGNRPETRERYLNSLLAFLAWCRTKASRAGLDAGHMPEFERVREAQSPRKRARRRVADLRPELIAALFDAMHVAIRAQLAAEWSTGARVSSILHGCRLCDLIMAPGREQITFHDTKNGERVDAALHPAAVAVMASYLAWRGRLEDREGPLFLTPRGRPYRPGAGTQNKTAFNAGKRRAVAALRHAAAAEARRLREAGNRASAIERVRSAKADAALLAQVTQHWFRHLLATEMLAGGDLRATMDQGGWRSAASVMGYAHDVPAHRRAVVMARRGFGTSLTRDRDTGTRTD